MKSVQGSQLIQVLTGAHDLNVVEINRREIIISPLNVVIHPQFNPVMGTFDVAVLRAPAGVKTFVRAPFANTIALPTAADQRQFNGNVAILLGWGSGSNNRLHSFQSVIMQNGFCGTFWPPGMVIDQKLCTTPAASRGPCTGDEGGAVVISDGGTRRLVGLIAWPACGDGAPDLHTRITELRPWIIAQ